MKNNSAVGILGVGMNLPEHIRRNDWWPASFREQFDTRARTAALTPEVLLDKAKTPAQRIQFQQMLETYHDPFRGSVERRVLAEGVPPSSMEIAAARQALQRAGIDPMELGTILSFSSPGDEYMPPNARLIQAALGAKKAFAFAVDSACSSFLTGMMVAEGLIRTGQSKYVLLVTSGTLSRLADWSDPGSVNYGDGAGAAVLGPVPAGLGLEATATHTMGELHAGVCVGPLNAEVPWYAQGGPMVLHSRNVKVAREIGNNSADCAKDATDAVLRKAGIDRKAVTNFYSHQPTSWFSESCRLAAGLDHCKTTQTFTRLGGMGSANVPVNLCHAYEAGQLKQGDLALLYACGGGFNWAATLLHWSAAPLSI